MSHSGATRAEHFVDFGAEGSAEQPSQARPRTLAWAKPHGAERFLAERYLRRPWLERDGVRGRFDVWALLDRIIPTSCNLQGSREARLHPDGRPDSARTARAWHALGWSLVARRAHEHEPQLAALADEFALGLDGRVDVQLYATPRMSRSFAWHIDPEEVFLLQTAGEMTVRLRENTACPQPLPERMPSLEALARERGPVIECVLSRGDWLYIPGGWWHEAQALSDSGTVAIGVMALTPVEALDCLRDHLLRCHAARARLPPTGTWAPGAPPTASAAAALEAVGELINSQLHDPEYVRALPALVRQRERLARERRARAGSARMSAHGSSALLRRVGA